jgi:adenylate cyclase
MKAPLPVDEEARLADLNDCGILDTAPEAAYDDLTRLASHICEAPIALVSLVDGDRQWFKSRVGIEAEQTPRDQAFCAHGILGREVLIVPDATADVRFSDNPLVVNDPGIRFYAGAPLVSSRGHGLGTLCVIDRTPRRLDAEQTEALRVLARQVVAQIELRRTGQALRRACKSSDHLLLSVLPPSVAERLKKGEKPIADSFEDATVLVAEVVDFSRATAELSPVEQVNVLNQMFCRFDGLVVEQDLQKLKAMGAMYHVVGGVLTPHPDPTRAVAEAALKMQTAALDVCREGVGPFSLRIGISRGPLVGGVIGASLLGYDVWGDTVNAARAMKTTAPPGGIQITQEVHERLCDDFLTEARGEYFVADVGEVTCYLLQGARGARDRD